MAQMQAAGVPSGVVKNAADLYSDPQLRQTRSFLAPQSLPRWGYSPILERTSNYPRHRHKPRCPVPVWESIPNMSVPRFWACLMMSSSNL